MLFCQAPPTPKLHTHKADMALVRYTHDMAAQKDTSTCNLLTLPYANTMQERSMPPNTPLNNCYNCPLHMHFTYATYTCHADADSDANDAHKSV